MRRFNVRAALITGVPFGAAMALFESNPGGWLTFSLAATLCAVVLGVPQGFLAAVPARHRGLWHKAGLLVAMVLGGLVLMVVAFVTAVTLPSIVPTGRWVPLPAPPARVIALAGPTCFRESGGAERIKTVYVIAESGRIFGLDRWTDTEQWSQVDTIPTNNCDENNERGTTPHVPGGETSRLVMHHSTVDCWEQLHVALSADHKLWRWRRGGCAVDYQARLFFYPLLSVVLNIVAWVTVAVGSKKSLSKSV